MGTTFNITLQATLLSQLDNKWLVTSTGAEDIPIALIVDTNVKNALLTLQTIFKAQPALVIGCVTKHCKAIVSGVHMFEEAAASANVPPEWASAPLIGITKANPQPEDDPTLYEVEYVQAGEAVRYIRGYVDPYLYKVINYIANDYAANPALYYYVLTNYISKFKKHLEEETETNA